MLARFCLLIIDAIIDKKAKTDNKADEDNFVPNIRLNVITETSFRMQLRHWTPIFEIFSIMISCNFSLDHQIKLFLSFRLVSGKMTPPTVLNYPFCDHRHANCETNSSVVLMLVRFRFVFRSITRCSLRKRNCKSICIWHEPRNCDAMNWLAG